MYITVTIYDSYVSDGMVYVLCDIAGTMKILSKPVEDI